MMDKAISVLLKDPFLFLIGAMTLAVFYIFRSYDKRIGSDLHEHSRRMNKINDEAKETAFKLQGVNNDFKQTASTLSISINSLKEEIRETQKGLQLEIKGLSKIITHHNEFAKKLALNDKKIDALEKEYGKVIHLEKSLLRVDTNQDRIVTVIKDIAEKVTRTKNER